MLPLLLSKVIAHVLEATARRRPIPGFAPDARPVNLALQGGGAHGAFTWGVLDQLLADGRIAVDGISGASAGAVNAVLLADGLGRGGADGARERLAEFWRAASFGGSLPDMQRAIVERLFAFMPRPGMPWLGAVSRYWSPYDLNPLNINPLKSLIERFVDFERLRSTAERQVFVSATNVQSGAPRVFSHDEITAEAVMASACLPFLFQAVEIDGVPYWDGGYSGNPTIIPFLNATATEDVLIVQINPQARDGAPTRARDIAMRLNELTFNATLLAELRMLKLAEKLIDEGRLPRGTGPGEYRRLRLHRIVMDVGSAFDDRGRINNDYDHFERLRDLGRAAAQQFLERHASDIGERATIDLLDEPTPKVA